MNLNCAEFYKTRLDEVRDSYATEKGKLLHILHEEQSKMEAYHDRSTQYLQGVTEGVARRYREMAADSKAELYVPHEEIRNKVWQTFIERAKFKSAVIVIISCGNLMYVFERLLKKLRRRKMRLKRK